MGKMILKNKEQMATVSQRHFTTFGDNTRFTTNKIV